VLVEEGDETALLVRDSILVKPNLQPATPKRYPKP
jgi:hypothetical protein